MTREEAIQLIDEIASSYYPCDKKDALEMAIKALEPCEDAISREDAIKRASQCLKGVFVEYEDIARKMFAEDKVPSVQSKMRTGHWIKITPSGIYMCSECEQNVLTGDIDTYHYCHHCGIKMINESEKS